MKRFLLAALLSFFGWSASADSMMFFGYGAPSGVAYTGPCDIVASPTAFYALRACGAAQATGSTKSVNVRRASDNTTQDILILSSGALDIASANTFAGADATGCLGHTTGLSVNMAFTSCSGAPNVGDTLSGAGFIQPSYIVSCGAFVAGAGTCVLNQAQNIGVAEAVATQWGMYVTKWYDQSGNSRDASQSTAAKQPQLLPTVVGGSPGALFVPANSSNLQVTTSTSVSSPWSSITVSENLTSSGNQWILAKAGSWATGSGGANTAAIFAGNGVQTVTASDAVFHALGFIGNGVSGSIFVDGTTTTKSTGSTGLSNNYGVGSDSTPASFWNGYIQETGLWSGIISGGNLTILCKNEQSFYGSGNFGAVC